MKSINGVMSGREEMKIGFLKDEILDYATYTQLAAREKNKDIKQLLLAISKKEEGHIKIWRRLLDGEGDEVGEPWFLGLRVNLLLFLKRFLGIAFVTRMLERDERNGLGRYEEGLKSGLLREQEKRLLRGIIKEERSHETAFASRVLTYQGELGYMQSIILGLNDGLVEILAVVAGLATVATTSFIVVVIGLIAGISGTLSMTGGVYLSSKSQVLVGEKVDGRVKPSKEGYYTGIYYFFGALLAVLPFMLGLNGIPGIALSVILVSLALVIASTIIAVISGTSITRRSFEMLAISLGAALATALFGTFAKIYFGVSI